MSYSFDINLANFKKPTQMEITKRLAFLQKSATNEFILNCEKPLEANRHFMSDYYYYTLKRIINSKIQKIRENGGCVNYKNKYYTGFKSLTPQEAYQFIFFFTLIK